MEEFIPGAWMIASLSLGWFIHSRWASHRKFQELKRKETIYTGYCEDCYEPYYYLTEDYAPQCPSCIKLIKEKNNG